jgi:hypothetical protein
MQTCKPRVVACKSGRAVHIYFFFLEAGFLV